MPSVEISEYLCAVRMIDNMAERGKQVTVFVGQNRLDIVTSCVPDAAMTAIQ
jgi:hypothetical protein